MKLSIVIVNWNVADLLAACLQSIVANLTTTLLPKVETVVVDNASTDESVAMVRSQFPWVRLIENHQNVGFAAANNQAIAASQGEYVLLLNPDTRLHPGALATLIEWLDMHPDVGAVGPLLENPNGTLQFSCYPAPTLWHELRRLVRPNRTRGDGAYAMQNWSHTQPQEVDVVQGACLMVRRTVLDQVGLLDEDYFIYTEEVDLCTRIRHAGWRIVWVPQAHVTHFGGQSTRQVAPEMFLQLYSSKIVYFRKHYGPMAVLLYKMILVLAALLRLGATFLTLYRRKQIHPEAQIIHSNYRRLLAALPSL